jgi:hypothetical protein
VTKVFEREYMVVFPSWITLQMYTCNGCLYLPLKEMETTIREAFTEPEHSVVLEKAWVLLSGVPKDLRITERLMAALTMVGRPVRVDERSLNLPSIRMLF